MEQKKEQLEADIQTLIESDIQSLILIYITSLKGSYFWRQNTGVFEDSDGIRRIRTCPAGTPDIIGTLNGRFIGIETKRRIRGKVSKDQKKTQANIERGGGLYIVARSVEDVRQALGDIS